MKKYNLKIFFIKLFSITIAVIIIINASYNIFLADRLKKIDTILDLSEKNVRDVWLNKFRKELIELSEKDHILNDQDKEIFKKIFSKIKKELN